MAEDFGFDGDFGGVGEFEAVGAEELDAVVLPGIVGGGDDYTGGEFVGVSEEGDGGSGDDSGGLYGGASGDEAGGEGGCDPGAGLAGVHAEEDFGGCSEMMGESDADGVDGGGVERGLAGDGSDAVGAEESFHCVCFSNFIIRVFGVGCRGFVAKEQAKAKTNAGSLHCAIDDEAVHRSGRDDGNFRADGERTGNCVWGYDWCRWFLLRLSESLWLDVR